MHEGKQLVDRGVVAARPLDEQRRYVVGANRDTSTLHVRLHGFRHSKLPRRRCRRGPCISRSAGRHRGRERAGRRQPVSLNRSGLGKTPTDGSDCSSQCLDCCQPTAAYPVERLDSPSAYATASSGASVRPSIQHDSNAWCPRAARTRVNSPIVVGTVEGQDRSTDRLAERFCRAEQMRGALVLTSAGRDLCQRLDAAREKPLLAQASGGRAGSPRAACERCGSLAGDAQ